MNELPPNGLSQSEQARHGELPNDGMVLLRWKGKTTGPHTIEEIERRLNAGEIGMMHEVQSGGGWMPLRLFFEEREAARAAEQRHREEAESKAREDAEKALLEREAQQQAEALAEQKRYNDLVERQIQAQQAPEESKGTSSGSSGFGGLLVIIGVLTAGFFMFFFDTSVSTGYGRVNNIGLLQDRQNGLLVGIALAVVGVVIVTVGARKK